MRSALIFSPSDRPNVVAEDRPDTALAASRNPPTAAASALVRQEEAFPEVDAKR